MARVADGGVDDQAPGSAGQLFHQVGGFIEESVPPDPGRHGGWQQRLKDRHAVSQGIVATPQHHYIATGGGSSSLFRQGAVSGYKRFESLVGVDGRRQGDQSSGLEFTQGRVDVLPAQIVRQGVTVELGDGSDQLSGGGWCAQGQIGVDHGLATGLQQRIGLLSGDRSVEPAATHQLLFRPGGLPDQQAEGVGTGARVALLFR